MTRHDDLIRLRHMLDAAREAVELAKGRTRADIQGDRLRQLSIERLLEIVVRTVRENLPVLIRQLEDALGEAPL